MATDDRTPSSADALPADLRREMEPVRKAPTLGRINGFGWTLWGSRDEHGPSNTYVATRAFCVLFVPVFPTDAWRVRRIDDRTWTFLGKVPLSQLAKNLQMAATAAGVVLVIVGLWPPAKPVPETLAAPLAGEEAVFTRVPIGPVEGRGGAPELGAWIDQERRSIAAARDSFAVIDAKLAVATQQLQTVERQLAAGPGTADIRERLVYAQANAARTLNVLYGDRRVLLARVKQREQELADSVRAFER